MNKRTILALILLNLGSDQQGLAAVYLLQQCQLVHQPSDEVAITESLGLGHFITSSNINEHLMFDPCVDVYDIHMCFDL